MAEFRPGLFNNARINEELERQREERRQQRPPRQVGFVDFGGGAVLPVDEDGVRFPRAGRASTARTSGGSGMFGIASPAEQYQIAQGGLNAAMGAIADENESRVNQRREMRRLGMDYEEERLRQAGANYRANVEAEASLIRQLLADM
jgi:hypothetical protein